MQNFRTRNTEEKNEPQAQPVPVTVNINHNYPNAISKKVLLSPRTPQVEGRKDVVCYVNGDLPSIVVHIGNRKYLLEAGEAMATGGKDIRIENPYSRTGYAQLLYNGTLQGMGGKQLSDDARSVQHVTYLDSVRHVAVESGTVSTDRHGIGILQREGSTLFKIKTNDAEKKIVFLPNSKAVFATAKPADFMTQDRKLFHTSGDGLRTVDFIAGSYTNDTMNEWIVNSGYDYSQSNIAQAYSDEFVFELQAGTAAFLYDVQAREFVANIKAIERGTLDGVAYV